MMDTHVIDTILRENNAFYNISNMRDAQELSSETNESLISDQDIYKEYLLINSYLAFFQNIYKETNRIDPIQFEEFELDESLISEQVDNILSNSYVSSKSKENANVKSEDCKRDKEIQFIEDKLRDSIISKQLNNNNSNQKQFVKKSNTEELQHDNILLEGQEQKQQTINPFVENIVLKKEIENLNMTLKQQEKENFYLHQNIKSLKEELYYEQKNNASKIYEDQEILRSNSTVTNSHKNQTKVSQDESDSLQNSSEKKVNEKQQLNQINVLNEQMNILRNEMGTMKDMYLSKLKEQSFLVETLTKKLGEKDEFIQKMKTSYINSLNQSKNSQMVQSQVYTNGNSINFSQHPHLLQDSCISDLSKPNSIHQSMLSQQQQQQQQLNQQYFNNTFDQVKLSQEFEQLRRDIKFSTIGNISPFLRDEKGGLREDLLSTASNLQQCANNSSSNTNYCNQSTNNYSKTYLQQQSPFNQSKYHNLSHMSNLSNRGFSTDFNPNSSINGNIMQSTTSQSHQQNQGSSSNITIMNQTGLNCNNSITTHMTSTSANSNNINANGNHNRSRGDPTNQKRNSSFTNSSANVSHNLNQSIVNPSQNSATQNANNSILQFTPVSHKHANQSSNSASQQPQCNQAIATQNTQTQIQQTQKQQQITLDFRLTFNQNELFNNSQSQQQQIAIISQDQNSTSNNNNISNPYIQEVDASNQPPLIYPVNKYQPTASQTSSHQKQNSLPPQIISSSNQPRGQNLTQNQKILYIDNENLTTDSKQKASSKDPITSNGKYSKIISDNEKLKDISNPNYCNNHNNNNINNTPHSSKVQSSNSNCTHVNKSLKEQLMHQQILQQKKQQILQNQQQQAYQNLIIKNNNQDLLKNLKRQTPVAQNSQNPQQNYSGVSPKKQQSRSYHIPSTQPQSSTNKMHTQQQNLQQQQLIQQPQQQVYLQEIAPKLNSNQLIGQSSTKSRKPQSATNQGINCGLSNLQDNTIPGSTMSVNSNFSNNLPIFRSPNEQQNHNFSCNSANNPNNNSFKFLNKNNISQSNGNQTSTNASNPSQGQIQLQVEKKRFLQTAQISSNHNHNVQSSTTNKFSSIASPSKYTNGNSEQKQLFLRTQQIYPIASNNNSNNQNQSNHTHQSSSTRQKSLVIPQQLGNSNQINNTYSSKVPMSAGSTRKNNSLSINNANNNNANILPNNYNVTTAHSTTSTQSGGMAGGLQEIFKFNQNDKQKKINEFFSKTLQVKPGELKSLNENLGCYSNTKNAAKLIQQMEFSSFDDVEIQLDDLQILGNQIKEVLQNDPLKKNAEERIYKNGSSVISQSQNNPLRQSGGGLLINGQQTTSNRSQSENHNYQNLQQQLQLHSQLNNCLNSGAQTVNVPCYNNNNSINSNNSKKVVMKSFDNTQQLQNYIDDAQMQLLSINTNSHSCTNQRVRPPKNNNFIFNENNKVITQQVFNNYQNGCGSTTSTSSATQHTRNPSANNGIISNANKNSNYKSHRKHLTLLNTDDINSKNQGNYPQSEISTQKAAFSDIHHHQLY